MGFIKKLIGKLGNEKKGKDEPLTPEFLLLRIFNESKFCQKEQEAPPFAKGSGWQIRKVREADVPTHLSEFNEGSSWSYIDSRGTTGGVLISQDPQAVETAESAEEDSPPPALGKLLFLEKNSQTGEYFLNFHFRLPMKFQKENRISIFRQAEGARVYRINKGEQNFILLLEAGIWDNILKNYPGEPGLVEGVEYFLFGKDLTLDEEGETLSLGISRPEEFMAGRFFLPRQISGKPEPVLSRFDTLTASKDEEFFAESQGLWFRVRMEIGGTVYPFYYYFDKLNREDALNRKNIFRQMFKLIIRKNLKNLKDCGIQVTKIAGEFDKPPRPVYHTGSVMMGFNLLSSQYSIHGWVVISTSLIKLILNSILPPWAFKFLEDNLLNRLRMLFSLSSELHASGRMELYERPIKDSPGDGDVYSKIRELKLNFIKVNELLELITLKEARLIISNLLYRQGWTGEKLRELFYFNMPSSYNDAGEPVFTLQTLIGFDEPRFRSFLMKNMLDQWQNSEHTGNDYNFGMMEHFKIMRAIREEVIEQKYLTPTGSLVAIIEGEFRWYREEMQKLLDETIQDKNYLKYSETHIPELNRLLTNMPLENLVTLFRYCPEDLPHFRGVISENLYTEVCDFLKNTDIELDEKAVETAVYYRKQIYDIMSEE
ncbi:MAG: hypothetical protein JEY99_17165 [Spirochaetales bacterium]|nr:hypothetical protein [Spirochaetales bacterium]